MGIKQALSPSKIIISWTLFSLRMGLTQLRTFLLRRRVSKATGSMCNPSQNSFAVKQPKLGKIHSHRELLPKSMMNTNILERKVINYVKKNQREYKNFNIDLQLNRYLKMKYESKNMKTNPLSRKDFVRHLQESIAQKKQEMEESASQTYKDAKSNDLSEEGESSQSCEEKSKSNKLITSEKEDDGSQYHTFETGSKIPISKSSKFNRKQHVIQKNVFDELDKDPLSDFNSTIISDERNFETYQEHPQQEEPLRLLEEERQASLVNMFQKPEGKKTFNFPRPHTPYVRDENGKKHLLSLYARDQSRRELIDFLMKRKKPQDIYHDASPRNLRSQVHLNYEQVRKDPNLKVDMSELNLLKIRETTYHRYEQEYKDYLKKEYQAIRKKSMLSRNPLVIFSRALSQPRAQDSKFINVIHRARKG